MKQTPHTAFDTLQARLTSKALKSTTKTLQRENSHKIPHKATLALAFSCAFSTAALAQIAESSVDSSQSANPQTPQESTPYNTTQDNAYNATQNPKDYTSLDYTSLQAQDLGKVSATAKGFESRLDELNRNVYIIDKDTIEQKGFKSTEEIFSYIPFITRNSIGLGSNLDLRGQGSSANVNVQVLLNGINLNMLDSSHGVTPINTIAPSDIERIEVLPGGGAVMYGNGTRGGVINIITKRRYEKFSPSVGISYSGVPEILGGGGKYKNLYGDINADVRFAGKITKGLYYGVSGRFLHKRGYRIGDKSDAYNVGGNLMWDITQNHSLGLEASYFQGYITTTPNSLFSIGTASLQQIAQGTDNSPSSSNRYNSGEGLIKIKQDRIDTALTYDATFNEKHKFQLKAFYHFFKSKYLTYDADLWYGVNMGQASRTMWVTDFNQDNSFFLDQKGGLQARYDWKHYKGLFIAGLDSIYNNGQRLMDLHYSFAMRQMISGHDMLIGMNADKWANSLYVIEKFDFTSRFSLTGGVRYENASYFGTRDYSSVGSGVLANTTYTRPTRKLHFNISNFAVEIAPNYNFGSGNIYAKYERGFRSPNPDSLTSVVGSGRNSYYGDSGVKSEYHHTFELGSKAQIGKYVFLSGSVFYTLTENELYSNGTPHSGVGNFSYGTYDLTQRAGVEIFSKQEFFGQSLRFSESFTYVDARILKGTYLNQNGTTNNVSGNLIPYISNYKATFGINYDFSRHFGIWTQNSFFGSQRDRANAKIKDYILTDLGLDMRFGDFSATFGVRNIFDTKYFMYYNSSRVDYTTEYSYLYAKGREVFLDLRYAF